MDLKSKRRMAADILKVGINRVWVDPDKPSEVSGAITKNDVRRLINNGTIKAKQKVGISSYRSKKLKQQKKKGRKSGYGKRKGKKGARTVRKEEWMNRIRALRKELTKLKNEKKITTAQYRKCYRLSQSGAFKNKAHMNLHIEKMRK